MADLGRNLKAKRLSNGGAVVPPDVLPR